MILIGGILRNSELSDKLRNKENYCSKTTFYFKFIIFNKKTNLKLILFKLVNSRIFYII
jgi:hypothetical protein